LHDVNDRIPALIEDQFIFTGEFEGLFRTDINTQTAKTALGKINDILAAVFFITRPVLFPLKLDDMGRAGTGAQAAGHTMMGLGVVKADELDVSPETRAHSYFLVWVLDRDNGLEESPAGDPQADSQALGPDQDIQDILYKTV
jgi:hypothetical protein